MFQGPSGDCTEAKKPGPAPRCSGRAPRGLWTPASGCHPPKDPHSGGSATCGCDEAATNVGTDRDVCPSQFWRPEVRARGAAGSAEGLGEMPAGPPSPLPVAPLPWSPSAGPCRPRLGRRHSARRCLRVLFCVSLRHSLDPEPTLVAQDLTLTFDFICKDLLSKRHQVLRV